MTAPPFFTCCNSDGVHVFLHLIVEGLVLLLSCCYLPSTGHPSRATAALAFSTIRTAHIVVDLFPSAEIQHFSKMFGLEWSSPLSRQNAWKEGMFPSTISIQQRYVVSEK